jgi:hypothetical protein
LNIFFLTITGALNTTKGTLNLDTRSFPSSDEQLYEILLEVRKETPNYPPNNVRISTKTLHLMVVPGTPPVMGILCADPALCFTDSNGNTFVNPSSRLALKAWCSLDEGSDCSGPMTYEWVLTLPGSETTIDGAVENSPTGLTNQEVAFFPSLFALYPTEEVFHVGLSAKNGLASTGFNRILRYFVLEMHVIS